MVDFVFFGEVLIGDVCPSLPPLKDFFFASPVVRCNIFPLPELAPCLSFDLLIPLFVEYGDPVPRRIKRISSYALGEELTVFVKAPHGAHDVRVTVVCCCFSVLGSVLSCFHIVYGNIYAHSFLTQGICKTSRHCDLLVSRALVRERDFKLSVELRVCLLLIHLNMIPKSSPISILFWCILRQHDFGIYDSLLSCIVECLVVRLAMQLLGRTIGGRRNGAVAVCSASYLDREMIDSQNSLPPRRACATRSVGISVLFIRQRGLLSLICRSGGVLLICD